MSMMLDVMFMRDVSLVILVQRQDLPAVLNRSDVWRVRELGDVSSVSDVTRVLPDVSPRLREVWPSRREFP
jgi:hypothetical protein